MIKVTAEFTIEKERESEFIKAARQLMEKSRMETGNISYGLYKSTDSRKIAFMEEWVDKNALNKHGETEHFKRIVPELNAMGQTPAKISVYEPMEKDDTGNVIFKRRSIRSFIKEKAVERGIAERLLKAGMQAPSARNKQPWEFLVLDKAEIIDSIAEIDSHFKLAAKAPLVIITLGNRKETYIGADNAEWYPLDLSAATQNILLEAVNLGLGAVWIGCYPDEKRSAGLRNHFNLPEHIVPFSVIAAGYSEEASYFKDRFNADKIHFNKY